MVVAVGPLDKGEDAVAVVESSVPSSVLRNCLWDRSVFFV